MPLRYLNSVRPGPKLPCLAAAVFAALLLYLATHDLVLAVAVVAVVTVALYDLAWLLRRVSRGLRVSPSSLEIRMWVWEEKEATVDLHGFVEKVETPSWLEAKVEAGKLKLRFKPRFYGVYNLDSLKAIAYSRLEIWRYRLTIPLRVKLVALPETLYHILRALAAAHGAFLGEGIHLTPLRSESGEYYSTREYAPGDSLRRVDWKATARTMRLMIKEYREVYGGEPLVAYSLECIGRHTCDQLASMLVSTVTSLALSNPSITLHDVVSGRVVKVSGSLEAIAYVVNLVFRARLVDLEAFYEFLEPPTLDELKRILGLNPHEEKVDRVEARDVVVLWCSVVKPHMLIDVLSSYSSRGSRVTLITCSKPWLDASNLEEAYTLYVTHSKIVEAARRYCAEVVAWRGGV